MTRDSSKVRLALGIVALVAVALVMLFARTCHATEAATLRAASSLTTVERRDGAWVYRARFVLTPDAPEQMAGAHGGTLRFAVPLPAGESLETGFGVAPWTEDGRIVGLRIDEAALDGRTVRATFVQPVKGAGPNVVGAPIAEGPELQIVDTSLGGGARIEIEPRHGLERRVGHLSPVGVGRAEHDEARRLTGFDQRVSSSALYVRGDDVRAMGDLTGRVVTATERARGSALAVGAIFLAVVGALVVAMRRLGRAASVERANAILAREIEELR